MKKLLLSILTIGLTSLFLTGQQRNLNDDVDFGAYGQGSKSIGISLFGQGLLGVPIRFINSENGNQIEVVPSISGRTVIFDNNDIDFQAGFNIGLGYNVFLGDKFKRRKNKVIKNYLGLKGGALLLEDPSASVGVTWRREAFYRDDFAKSRGLDLGIVYSRAIDGSFVNTNGDLSDAEIQLFFRIDWNWYKN
jgi:hypothetical protein